MTCKKLVINKNISYVLTFIYSALVLGMTFDVLREPLVKLFVRVEECRHYEMEEGP